MRNIAARKGYVAIIAVLVAALAAALLIFMTRGGQGGERPPQATGVPAQGNVLGDPNAPVLIIEYSDFQCPFCRRFALETERLILEDYIKTGKARLEYRHYAFLGPESQAAAEAAECANEQGKFWPYHNILFQRQGAENSGAFSRQNLIAFAQEVGLDVGSFTSCLDSRKYRQKVISQTEEGKALGVRGTPTFFIGDIVIRGAQPYDVFRQTIEQALDKAKGSQ